MANIRAKYAGKCALSGKSIKPGDLLTNVKVNGMDRWVLVSAVQNGTSVKTLDSQEIVNRLDNIIGYFSGHFKTEVEAVQVFNATSQTVIQVYKFEHKFSPWLQKERFHLFLDVNEEKVYLSLGKSGEIGGIRLEYVIEEDKKDNIVAAFMYNPEIYWEAFESYVG